VTLTSDATNVSVTCLNLPAGATCSYSVATGVVTIATTAATATGSYQVTGVFAETRPGAASALVLLPLLMVGRKRRKRLWVLAGLALVLTAVALVGCGGGGGGGAVTTVPAAHP